MLVERRMTRKSDTLCQPLYLLLSSTMDESLSQDHTSPQATESSLIAKVLNVVVLLLFDIAMLTFGVLLVNDCPLHLTVATTPAAFAVSVQCLILVLATCSKWPPLLLYGLHMICFCGA